MHKGCTEKVCFLDSSDIFSISFLAKWATVHSLVLFTLTLSHNYHSDTRWFRLILYDPYFKKNSLTSGDQTTGNKERLGSI